MASETWCIVHAHGVMRAEVSQTVATGHLAALSEWHGWRAVRVGDGPYLAATEAMGDSAEEACARPRRGYEYSAPHCEGTGREPVAGSVAAWLDAQDAMARAGVDRAERAVTEAAAAMERAIEHADAVMTATAKARARLARKAGE